ncbi:MAG: [protein-PII] uridylyltransferase [Rhizobiales bacterium]|nr:[protein-PII] uridylyltransferase [Hyphomicrobiales bacterium]MBI3673971.1 [protein-PII] uridylyltransferase [Hyphomicrobiales bacterium]
MNAASPSAAVIDEAGLSQGLAELLRQHGAASAKLRPAVVTLLKETLEASRTEAERRLLADGRGTQCAERLAETEDQIIHALFDLASRDIFPPPLAGEAERIAVVAVGGYGRGTLAPGSDIDLLFVLPAKQSQRIQAIVEFILYCLWDIRQKVGHATRSIEECIRLAKTDSTILTSILEARYICGDRRLYDDLVKGFRSEIVAKGARQFVANKLAERDLRHRKSGESRYLVEPDVKDGKGGLRDLNTLFWIAKFLYASNSPDELAEKGAFARDELALFKKCENFLWAVRCHLHFLSGRGNDRLSFDRQSDIAVRLGYKAHGGLRHVERFMKHYFLVAKDVGDLTRILCASLEARQVKDAPALSRMFGRFLPKASGIVADAPAFRLEAGRVALKSPKAFAADPVNLIRLFAVAAKYGAEVHPDALKVVRASLNLIRKELCDNPEANAIFLELLAASSEPETLLRMMNEAGVLGRFIPAFGRIVAMMQFNMYHHYTVDEHLIRAVGILSAIDQGRLSDDHPLSVSILPTVTSKRALYVAVLLHDIAKGRQEDHSIAGARIAEELCPRFGLSAAETETVAWLIRHHLLMSETAQMRDLNDFKTILDFAAVVQSLERLKLLLILTVADIRAVGPGVWNGWKGQLLRTLYAEAEPVLSGGHTSVSRQDRVAEAQAVFFAKFPAWSEAEKAAYAARHYDAYWLSVPPDKQLKHQALIARATPQSVMAEVETDAFTAITELTVYVPDHPRLLALITGACAAAGANIAGAQIFTTTDGMALDTILIQREFADEEDERRRAERVAELIRKALRGELWLKEAVAKAYKPQYRIAAFTVEPRVIIDNQSSNRFTVIEINGLDRIGLLYDLTEALYRLNFNIASAHVTTFGEKAIDVFYVTDLTGAKIESATRHRQIQSALAGVLAPPQAAVAARA